MNNIQYTTEYLSSIGLLTIASDGKNITGLWIKNQKYYAATLENYTFGKTLPIFDSAKEWLDIYFAGEKPTKTLPLLAKGSDFRKSVWNILCDIPYGEVISYGEIAKKIADKMSIDKMSAQAVGGAVGHNPISIIIPCHRVVGSNGSLTGYASGIDKKIKLLKLEKIDTNNFFIPKKGTAL